MDTCLLSIFESLKLGPSPWWIEVWRSVLFNDHYDSVVITHKTIIEYYREAKFLFFINRYFKRKYNFPSILMRRRVSLESTKR